MVGNKSTYFSRDRKHVGIGNSSFCNKETAATVTQ